MPTLIQRLDKLENSGSGKGRFIVVQTGSGHSQEDVAQALEARQIYRSPSDTIVCLKTMYQDLDGRDQPAKGPPMLLSITP